MDEEQKEYYKSLTEEIFSKSPEERQAYLKKLKKMDGEYYEQIEHLIRFVTSREDLLEDYAYHRIKRILGGLSEEE
ncbi:MAG: hypothetical protein R6V27_10965 [Balneolaceae bacterium]